MKTLHAVLAIAAAAALSANTAHAQLLGGGIGSSMSNAMGGALGASIDRGGMMDGRFGSSHTLRTADTIETQPSLPRPAVPTANTAQVVANDKATAAAEERLAAGRADSATATARKDGAWAVHGSELKADELKSAGTSRAESGADTARNEGAWAAHGSEIKADEFKSTASSRPESASAAEKPEPSASAAARPSATRDETVRTPAAEVKTDGYAANHTRASGGPQGWSAGSQTQDGGGASAAVE